MLPHDPALLEPVLAREDVRDPERRVRHPVPGQIVQEGIAVQGLVGTEFQAHLGHRAAARVRNGPLEDMRTARLQLNAIGTHNLQLVVLAEYLDVQAGHQVAAVVGTGFQARLDGLPCIQGRGGIQGIAAVCEVLVCFAVRHKDIRVNPAVLAQAHAAEADGQRTISTLAVAPDVAHRRHPGRVAGGILLEPLHRTGEREMVAGTVLVDGRLLSRQPGADVYQARGLRHRVRHGVAAVGRGQQHAVRDRSAPVGTALLDAGQAVLDAQQAADVAGVAVGVPTAGVDDHQTLLEIVVPVQQRVDDEGVVGHHVAIAAILVVPVLSGNQFPALAPVRFLLVPLAQFVDHPIDHAVAGNERDGRVNQLVQVVLDKGLGFHGRHHLGPIDGFAAVGDHGGLGGQPGRAFRVARSDQGPAVNEDLGTNLLGHHLAVGLDRAAVRPVDAALEAQVGRVLGRVAEPAPPEDGAFLDQVVEPGAADVACGQILLEVVVLHRPHKGERPRNVVVGNHQRHVQHVVHVVVDLAQVLIDHLDGPTFEGASQIDADNLAQHARVDALGVVSL